MVQLNTDVLIVGAGAAGMYASISAAKSGAEVILCDKSLISRGGATVMAQMTVAAAIGHQEPDHWTHHLRDTIRSGQGLCNEKLSYQLCKHAPDKILEMRDWKTDWANDNGRIKQVLAPGHEVKRCCYVDFLNTGPAVARTLRGEVAKNKNIKRLSSITIIDIVVKNSRVAGAIGLNTETGEYIFFRAKAVVLAAGGLTQLFARNSASKNMGGDAHSLALRAGANLIDMEFVQFFPIGHLAPRLIGMDPIMWDPFRYKLGGKLLNGEGKQFIENYGGEDGETYKVGRDLAAYAILKECEAGRGSPSGGAWLSFQHLSKSDLEIAFGPIIKKLASNDIDLTQQSIEVAPIAHYHMGGIEVDESMETCVKGLFAAGECVGGANGANRLSGNAIPEAFVFGDIAGTNSAKVKTDSNAISQQEAETELSRAIIVISKPAHVNGKTTKETARRVLHSLQRLMWENVGVLRDAQKLQIALCEIKRLRNDVFPLLRPTQGTVFNTSLMDWLDLRNSLLCAEAICLAASERKESRGAHQMEDIPFKLEEFAKNQIISSRNGNLISSWKTLERLDFDLKTKSLAEA
jgi:succinate dehydrogenase/fumarate reductase flavoprotein subunit